MSSFAMMSPKKQIRTNLSVSHDSGGAVFHPCRGWMCVWQGQFSGGKSIMFLLVLSGKVKTGGFVLVSEQGFLPSNPSCKLYRSGFLLIVKECTWFPDAGTDHCVMFVLAYP